MFFANPTLKQPLILVKTAFDIQSVYILKQSEQPISKHVYDIFQACFPWHLLQSWTAKRAPVRTFHGPVGLDSDQRSDQIGDLPAWTVNMHMHVHSVRSAAAKPLPFFSPLWRCILRNRRLPLRRPALRPAANGAGSSRRSIAS